MYRGQYCAFSQWLFFWWYGDWVYLFLITAVRNNSEKVVKAETRRIGSILKNSDLLKAGMNDRNLFLMHSYQESKTPRESHLSARRQEL